MEDYLRRIYRLEQEADSRVSNSEIAVRLGVTGASVTRMLGKLSNRGLIARDRSRPIRLTTEGKDIALRVVRRHRLAESMLAELFEYAISEATQRPLSWSIISVNSIVRKSIGSSICPETDPHGDPIPDSTLDLSQSEDGTSLIESEESTSAEVTRILTQDEEVLEYLGSTGLEPTERLHLDTITPIGMVVVTIGGANEQTSLRKRLTSQILVSPLDDE